MKHFLTTILLAAVCFCGCSSNAHVPLSGRITFEDNGEPLTTGSIAFVKGTDQARSEIDSDGRYTLGFLGASDGLPKGEYKIYIQAVHTEYVYGRPNADGEAEVIDRIETPLIASKYRDPATSGLTFTADGKSRTFDIKVERAGR